MRIRFSKAQRRHDNRRLKQRRFVENKLFSTPSNDLALEHLRAAKRLNTACPCSCSMCCSPRKTYGNSKAALSMQERRRSFWKDELE